ncbi:O-Antigen ligase [Planctomycetes bacterium Pla163]|uniref:O-Antigen ligase n=1 Tax=Rohdeia mirabilis TaxID=2528008 RepID=A0A518D1Q1_9BACT|nr:O-Antigen ligase [Planctomycetes bacterium Pla163]
MQNTPTPDAPDPVAVGSTGAPPKGAEESDQRNGGRPNGGRPDDGAFGRIAPALAALAIVGTVGWWAFAILDPWVAAGRFPRAYEWTSGWPLAFAASTGVGLVAGLVRRSNPAALAAGLVVGAFSAMVAAGLPSFSSNATYGDGPFLMPVYAIAIAVLAIYVPAGPRSHPPTHRILAAALILCTANTLPFARDTSTPVALLVCLVALALLGSQRQSAALLPPAPGADRTTRAVWYAGLALIAWVALAAAFGDSVPRGTIKLQSVVAGALLCYALATRLRPSDVGRVLTVLVAGVGIVVVSGLLSELDVARDEGWPRVLASRLRLFGAHPNQIGPAFAGGALLCGTLALLSIEGESMLRGVLRRGLLLVLAGACVVLVWRAQSEASSAGVVVGAAVALWSVFGPLPRRVGRIAIAVVALAIVGLGLWATPLADPAREWLQARALEPNSAIGQRYHYWKMSSAAIADHPLFGVGPGQYYMHARYAEPSYYDGTNQSFHPHNLLFAVAEGSGLPSLAFLLVLVGGLLEFARRALLGLTRGRRALIAAPLALTVGTLSTNLLDLGQVQPTYLPLHLWITLGLCATLANVTGPGATARSGSPAGSAAHRTPSRTMNRIGRTALVVALVGFGLLPIAADGLIHSGRLMAFTAKQMRAGYDRIALGRTLYPPHPQAYYYEVNLLGQLNASADEILEARRAEARRTPGDAQGWLMLAAPLLRRGYFDEGARVIERVLELDPHGPDVGKAQMLRAWVEMYEGREEDARESLFQALVNQSTDWGLLPNEQRRVEDSPIRSARRIVFMVRSRDEVMVQIELDDIVERLGEYAISSIETDPYLARRSLLALFTAYDGLDRPDRALYWIERYTARVESVFPSIRKLEWVVLDRLGMDERAAAVVDTIDPSLRELFADTTLSTQVTRDPRRRARVTQEEMDRILSAVSELDVFEDAASPTPRLELSVAYHAAMGDWDRALADARRTLRCYDENNPRRNASEKILTSHFVDRGAPALVILRYMADTISLQDVAERRSGGKNRMLDAIAGHIYTYWLPSDGNVVDRARELLGGTGPAGDGLVERLERLYRADHGDS